MSEICQQSPVVQRPLVEPPAPATPSSAPRAVSAINSGGAARQPPDDRLAGLLARVVADRQDTAVVPVRPRGTTRRVLRGRGGAVVQRWPAGTPALTAEQEYAGNRAYYESTRQSQLDLRNRVDSAVRAELPRLSASDVESRWKRDKDVFIAVASTPNHGLKAALMLRIYIRYWADRYNSGSKRRLALAWEAFDTDDRYFEKIHRFRDGEREAMGPEYALAENDEALGAIALRQVVDVHAFLLAAERHGKSLTIDELTKFAIARNMLWQPVVEGILGWAALGRGLSGTTPHLEGSPPESPAASRPVAGFGRPLEPPAAPPATSHPMPTTRAAAVRPVRPAPPTSGSIAKGRAGGAREPTRMSGDGPAGAGSKPAAPKAPAVGKVETATDVGRRISKVKEWEKANKITGDSEQLKSRLRSNDPQTRADAEAEFDEASAKIAQGQRHHVEEFETPVRPSKRPEPSRISTTEKSELENSAWLKKRLPNASDRKKFMDSLTSGHKRGDQGAELKPGDRDVGKHEHFKPGSPALEAKVREWEANGKPSD